MKFNISRMVKTAHRKSLYQRTEENRVRTFVNEDTKQKEARIVTVVRFRPIGERLPLKAWAKSRGWSKIRGRWIGNANDL